MKKKKRVLIVGGGFGGVAAAKALRGSSAEVGLIDRRNYHLFQPLLYQVATAALNPSDIACPIRKIFRKHQNINVVIGDVQGVDLPNQTIVINKQQVPFDYLILAAGATHSYFGNDHWSQDAPGLKSIDDATEIRRRFLLAFEAAEVERDEEARRACLTFVIVGAGPTGCELAGAIAEVARYTIPKDFRHVDTTTARVILIDGGSRILKSMPESCSQSAHRQLESLGVDIKLHEKVTGISSDGVHCGETFVPSRSVFWAAGVKASPLGESLDAELDSAGRVIVNPDLTIPHHANVFVIGDQAAMTDLKTGQQIPGVAQGAMQGGSYVGKIVAKEIAALDNGESTPSRTPFHYFDKGNLATIGRNKAVADALGVRFGGFFAWLIWAGVHILFLVNFRSKIAVGWMWAWTYFSGDRDARLITGRSKIHIKHPPEFD
ncbi:MAG: NAD(P)/FAD-dependent oxidoreductase [Verrucomicrobiota bacterium]